jgi:hypothetical protein
MVFGAQVLGCFLMLFAYLFAFFPPIASAHRSPESALGFLLPPQLGFPSGLPSRLANHRRGMMNFWSLWLVKTCQNLKHIH